MESIRRRPSFGIRSSSVCAVLLCLSLTSAAVLAQAVVIDSFATSQSALTLTFPPAGTSASSSVSGAGILGGERDVQLNLTAGIIAGNTASATVSSGFYSYSQDATIAANSVLQWDGTDGSATLNPTGLGGVDLTAGGTQDALQVSVFFDDLPVNVTIDVFTDAGNASTATIAMPGLIFSASNFVVPYSAFSTSLGAGATFSNVGAIRIAMGSTTTAPDVVLDFLQTTSLVSATETVSPNAGVAPGATVHYTAVISNPADLSGAGATGVVFTNPAVANGSLVVGSVTTTQGTVTTGNTAGDTSVAVNVGAIADGASVTVGFDVAVNSPVPAGVTQISSQGTVKSASLATGVSTDDPAAGGAADPTVATLTASPALAATETVALQVDANGNGLINPGDTVRYTAVITNTGNQGAAGVVFTNGVDPNADLVVGSVTTTAGSVTLGNTAGNTSVAVNVGALAGAGGTVTIRWDVKLRSPFPAATLSSQGSGTATNAPSFATDDPAVAGAANPTIAAVSPASVIEVPALGLPGLALLFAALAAAAWAFLRRRSAA